MQATGNRPPGAVAAKAQYMMKDLARLARAQRLDVALSPPPRFPINTIQAQRALTALRIDRRPDDMHALAWRCFNAVWVHGEPLDEMATLQQCARDALGSTDAAEALLTRAQEDDVKAALRAATDGAVDEGAFGVPSFVCDDGELFFGVDRIPLLAQHLKVSNERANL